MDSLCIASSTRYCVRDAQCRELRFFNYSGSYLGLIWDLFGNYLDLSGSYLNPSGTYLGPIWDLSGPICTYFGYARDRFLKTLIFPHIC